MNPFVNEVITAHVAIEHWLGKGEGDIQALLAHFAPTFSMVTIGGGKLGFAELSAFFQGQKAGKQGLKIELSHIETVAQWSEGAVISYSEKQSLPGQPATVRHSTVVFRLSDRGLLWQHLHETSSE
ncbi:nuclear transport factor 2 family protein [Yersinia hibernica]|uniref:DUF4440 domain-containing protein n=1 Tax=Yersinia enterocolitica LC20 TaxID=1443113 RepID=A0A7U4GDC3_YEREN|nr:nuclear transport factor 2 family protein [Yersinia hibernica]AHM72283.1 DUF4440 domain-containing protein [Yersinia hibernica]OVZ81814.1 DUF4440 domain-containing protein [Yersinia kristensenii]